ncbi:hypothetical protein CSAL01_08989 [Colletotrichum salicis]|uniref:Uncharacterized protein n=1 Tax=Colletotrichum salicis TaxID=1209931 RepID=A0A135URH1_9PEZI|nr:hypothetical protein CSAL01_08989 [Colletotrichum salicis]
MASWEQEVPALRADINGDVLLPGDEGYKESLVRWSIVCIKPAGIVVKPKIGPGCLVSDPLRHKTRHPFHNLRRRPLHCRNLILRRRDENMNLVERVDARMAGHLQRFLLGEFGAYMGGEYSSARNAAVAFLKLPAYSLITLALRNEWLRATKGLVGMSSNANWFYPQSAFLWPVIYSNATRTDPKLSGAVPSSFVTSSRFPSVHGQPPSRLFSPLVHA